MTVQAGGAVFSTTSSAGIGPHRLTG
jgi:hypothetical protein